MLNQPEEITLAKLEVVIMPNGEVICAGKRVNWFKNIKKYLSEPRSGITGEPIVEKHE